MWGILASIFWALHFFRKNEVKISGYQVNYNKKILLFNISTIQLAGMNEFHQKLNIYIFTKRCQNKDFPTKATMFLNDMSKRKLKIPESLFHSDFIRKIQILIFSNFQSKNVWNIDKRFSGHGATFICYFVRLRPFTQFVFY